MGATPGRGSQWRNRLEPLATSGRKIGAGEGEQNMLPTPNLLHMTHDKEKHSV